MSVTSVYGKANSSDIIFSDGGSGIWTASVPATDGEYVVEVTAEDEAGNTAYLCTLLFTVSGHRLKISVVPRGYSAGITTNGFRAVQTDCKE